MLYHLIVDFFNFSIDYYFVFGLFAFLIGMAIWSDRLNLIRLIVGLLSIWEIFTMSRWYACSGVSFIARAPNTYRACSDSAYTAYMNANFGFDLWYIQIAYILVVLFMVWPFFGAILDHRERAQHAARQAKIEDAIVEQKNELLERIRKNL